jgi:hypothetical protein
MRSFLAGWELYRVEVHEVEALGDGRFLAVATQHGKGAAGQVDITAPAFIALRVRDDEISQLEFWLEREPALAALGL